MGHKIQNNKKNINWFFLLKKKQNIAVVVEQNIYQRRVDISFLGCICTKVRKTMKICERHKKPVRKEKQHCGNISISLT